MNDELVARPIDVEPLREAGANCGFYFVVFLIAVMLNRIFPNQTALTCTLVLLPYPLVLGFTLFRGSVGRPWFPIGNPLMAVAPWPMIWAILALAALLLACIDGLGRPMSGVGVLNHIGTILGAPLAEEFVFRAALLSSLNRTQLSTMQVAFDVPMSVIAGAVIYSIVQFLIFLAAGFAFPDALATGALSLMIGVGFGAIYVRTQNVWYGVFLHMLLNFARWVA